MVYTNAAPKRSFHTQRHYLLFRPAKRIHTCSLGAPDTLTAVANGRLQKRVHHPDGTTIYRWAVVSPINNYGITFYIGKYVMLSDTFHGEKGQLDIQYCVLDYNKAKAQSYLRPEVHKTLKVLEYWLGPYPFYADGFKMVEAPYIGMEQSFYGRQAAKEFFHDRSRTREDSIIIGDQPLISAHDIYKDAGDGMYIQGWALIHMLRAIMDFYISSTTQP